MKEYEKESHAMVSAASPPDVALSSFHRHHQIPFNTTAIGIKHPQMIIKYATMEA